MLYKGAFSGGDSLSKSKINNGLIFCKNAESLFSLSKGYVGIKIQFPDNIINGVYSPILYSGADIKKYILWGVNIGKYASVSPGLEAFLTKDGIQFSILSSASRFTITDNKSNIPAKTDVFFEFLWDANGIDGFDFDTKITMVYRVNGENKVVSNPPISNDSIQNLNFCLLNTPFFMSGLECNIKEIIIKDGIPNEIIEELVSSSSESSSMSSVSTGSSSSNSSSSYSSSSSSSSFEEQKLDKFVLACEFSKLHGGTNVGGTIWISDDKFETWSEKTNFSDGTSLEGFWKSAAISSDGRYQLIGGKFMENGVIGAYPIARSSDYGNTWSKIIFGAESPTVPPSVSYNTEFSVAISGSGQYQTLCPFVSTAAPTTGLRLYVSNTWGTTWSARGLNRRWVACAMSNNGKYQVACANNEGIYVSNNYGNSWTKKQIAGISDISWKSVSISSIGNYICAISNNAIVLSSNYGGDFIIIATHAGAGYNWNKTVMSKTGQFIYVSNIYSGAYSSASKSSQIYITTNWGHSWKAVNLPSWNAPSLIDGYCVDSTGSKLYYARGTPDTKKLGSITFPSETIDENSGLGMLTQNRIKKWSEITLNRN